MTRYIVNVDGTVQEVTPTISAPVFIGGAFLILWILSWWDTRKEKR